MQDLTPEQRKDLELYCTEPERAPRAWRDGKGEAWAERNPVALEDTEESFRRRYGRTKSWIVRDAVRGIPREATWLEVGCSAGAFQALVESLGFQRPVGVDISHGALRRSPYRGAVAQADALYLPFADGAFDGVTTAGSFMHVGPPERMRACARELARVARRWFLLVELWSETPWLVSFGELLPPVWLYPWEQAMPEVLGPAWQVAYSEVYELTKQHVGLKAAMSVLLLERAEV